MILGRPVVGLVEGETPAVQHRFGTISGRSCCGKPLVAVAGRERSGRVVCQRCVALEKARREGMPDWF